ncbi:MucBP domain-containing protein [Ligilactobacillus salivarius]|nr:MucBP domain-containing protein [Ligilactobacillus salivarius]
MSDGLKMGTLTLDYDARKIFTTFTADLDPDKLYRGHMEIGTFVSRDYFKNLNNETTVPITLPDGTTVEQPLTVIFDEVHKYPISYEQATKQVMSDDKTQADVSWAVLINPQGEEMQQPTIYLTTNDIKNANADYGQAKIWYADPAQPSTLDPSSIKLYEAQIYPSLGYTKGKQLTSGVDYEITEGNIDGIGQNMKDVWVVKLKGNYLNTHGQFVVEYNTHHDHLDPNASSGDSGAAVKTEVSNNGMFVYKDANNRIQVNEDGFFGATVGLIDSDVTVDDTYGSVDVKYVDTEGNILPGGDLKTVKDNAPVGEDYTTEKKSFVGYHFVRMDETSDPATGVVAKGTKHVIYVYEKDPETPEVKTGSVDVKYVDRATGEVLPFTEAALTTVKDKAPEGETYDTSKKDFKGYTFVGMTEESAAADGSVVADKTLHVIYAYDKIPETEKGSVDVKYVDTKGNILPGGDLKTVKDNAPVGEDYTTEEKTFGGYHFVGMDKTSDAANGKVTEGTKHVIYVYEKDVTPEVKTGSVDVKYVDRATGEVLPFTEAALTTVKDKAPEGETYDTSKKDFKGYTFVGMTEESAAADGSVVADKTLHVIYAYDKIPETEKGSVDVKYVDTKGNILPGGDLKTVKDNAPVGEDYTTEEKTFGGYHFVGMDKTSDAANGKVTEGTKHVIYVYEKDPETPTPEVKKGNVDVKYITTDGKVLEDVTKVKDNAPVGEAYTTEEKSFDGYHFVGMDKTSDSANGKVTEGDKHVVYVYEKDVTPEVKKGSVDVKYVTTDGKVLEDVTKVKDNAPVGEAYTTEEKSFDGYHFVGMDKTSDSANGKVTEGDKHVVYVYEKDETPEVKKGSVDVKYVTTDGKVLEDVTKVKENAPVGETYTTEEKSFDGYHFVGMDKTSDSANGKVTEGDKHVVYVYEKDETPEVKKGSVDVKYVTTDGKVLEDVTKVKDNAPVGEAYTTEEKSFDGYHFVGMDKTSDSANGKVTEGDKHIVYVYEKDPEVPTTPVEKKGSVYVKYVDENGNELPGGEKITVVKDGKVGSYYFTTEKDFDGYTFSHMAEGSSDPTGKVVEGDQQVVYVYTKNNTPQPEPNKPEVPTTSETPAVPQEEKTTTDTPVKTSKVNAEKVTVNKATVLPQTGDKKENNSSVMGLVSLGLAGLLGLGIKRKEEKDNH